MTHIKFDYSTDMIIFSSLLYNCSPKGYRLLIDSKNIILPSNLAIKILIWSIYMNTLIIYIYIKKNFNLLVQKDSTVS